MSFPGKKELRVQGRQWGKITFASIGCSLDPCRSTMCWKIRLGNTFFQSFLCCFLLNPSIINTAHALWNSQLLFCQLIYKNCKVTSTANECHTRCSSLVCNRNLAGAHHHWHQVGTIRVLHVEKKGQKGILSCPRAEAAVADIGLMLMSCFTVAFLSSWLWDNRAKILAQRSVFFLCWGLKFSLHSHQGRTKPPHFLLINVSVMS